MTQPDVLKAQNKLKDDPGYVDMSQVEDWFGRTPSLEVNIKGALLKLVAEASRYEDPELANLLFKLKAIQVRGFPLSWSKLPDIQADARALGQQLEEDGWDTVVRVREDDEGVDMYLRMDQEKVAGMIVMVVQPGEDETVFINIVGEIDPEQMGRLGRKFNFGDARDW